MSNLGKACAGLAALAFVLAVVSVFTGTILVPAEAYSRAANNLALLALCVFIGFREGPASA